MTPVGGRAWVPVSEFLESAEDREQVEWERYATRGGWVCERCRRAFRDEALTNRGKA